MRACAVFACGRCPVCVCVCFAFVPFFRAFDRRRGSAVPCTVFAIRTPVLPVDSADRKKCVYMDRGVPPVIAAVLG